MKSQTTLRFHEQRHPINTFNYENFTSYDPERQPRFIGKIRLTWRPPLLAFEIGSALGFYSELYGLSCCIADMTLVYIISTAVLVLILICISEVGS